MTEEQKSLGWLSSILDVLLRDCPWDRAQTIESLRYLTIEEVFELSEAIIAEEWSDMRKELGDLFLHLLFYSKLAERKGWFTSTDVLDSICGKLISRHPHISLPDRDGVMIPAQTTDTPKWEQVKMKEGRKTTLEGVPASLPPLVKAIRMQEKAAGRGFEFANAEGAKAKADEEYNEFLEALEKMDSRGDMASKQKAEEELGDLIFALTNWARMRGLNADDALCRANQKFFNRFNYVENQANEKGKALNEMSFDEMANLWKEAKTI